MGKGGNVGERLSRGRRITPAELAKHKEPTDAWVAIEGKVYDISKWTEHPGGRVLYTAAGADASDTFGAFHSGAARDMMERFYIGDLEGKASDLKPFEREMRDLVGVMKAKGMFKSSKLYYAFKFLSTTAIVLAAAYVAVSFDTLASKLGGAVLLALFWQQCGWLAHDFAHHQVFRWRSMNDAVVLCVGNLYQGFSMDWWKNKHNTHHAIPNLHESEADAHDGDPDIDTLPFLAWSVKLARKTRAGGTENTPSAIFMVNNQSLLYFPILTMARLTWSWQSFAYAYEWDNAFWNGESKFAAQTGGNKLRYPLLERVLIALHYLWVGALSYMATAPLATAGGLTASIAGVTGVTPLRIAAAVAWFFFAQFIGGFLLAVPFGVGHNGMKVWDADKRPGFAELQVTTTRNVNSYLGFTGWFMGGLHHQIEHHLFPTMPRHNLGKCREMVEAVCKKHGIEYRATSLATGTWEVLSHLSTVAEAVKEFPAV